MSPAAHAVVGAVIASRYRRMAVALPLAFLSHFVFDSIPHFESFDGLAEALGTSKETAFWTAAGLLGAVVGVPLLWAARKHRELLMFVAAASTVSIAMRIPGWEIKAISSLAIAALFLLLTRSKRMFAWTLAAAAATSPDVLKFMHDGFKLVHGDMHFTRGPGYWLHRLVGPGGDVFAWERMTEPWFVVGALLEVAAEAFVLLWGVGRLSRALDAAKASDDRADQAGTAKLGDSEELEAVGVSTR